MRAFAHAKVNLSLRLSSPRDDGLHPVRGLFQSIGWSDGLELTGAEEDSVSGSDGSEAIDGMRNLAWHAVAAVRALVETARAVRLVVDKCIPVAAGLGGGSADAAAALALAGRRFDVGRDELANIAPNLGSDVPFCFIGGKAVVGGIGERVERLPGGDVYGLALVVPPIELSTAEVYAAWDRLEGPKGPLISGRDLPPALRDEGSLANDLFPAAVATTGEIDEWHAELSARWSRPVLMTGSGPTLFGFFVDREEAGSALTDIPIGARAAEAATPIDRGWELMED